MSDSLYRPSLSRTTRWTLMILAAAVVALLSGGRRDYPELHPILDTCMFLLSGVLALSCWDIGVRRGLPFPKWIAVTFALTSLTEFVHAFFGGSQALIPVAQAADMWRPSTWPSSAYLLPIGIGGALLLVRTRGQSVRHFALSLIILGIGLHPLFHWLPTYTSPVWFRITRPALMAAPLLWAVVGLACWRLRVSDRFLAALALMAAVLLVSNVSMLYSRAPHDAPAMAAHLGRVGGYLILLLSLMQMASFDLLERTRSERELAQLNFELERRVTERTAQLQSTNESLEAVITERKQAKEARVAQAEELARQALELTHSQQALKVQTTLLQSVLDGMGEGLVAADEHGKFTLWNPAAERLFGLGSADIPSQNWPAHYGIFLTDALTPFPADLLPLTRAIRGESSSEEMFVLNPKLAKGLWLEVTGHPLRDSDGSNRGGVAAFRDVSEKKIAAQEIRNLNEALEHRVDERTAQLEEANKELESFTYTVAHDLRAPLRHIAGFSGILVEEFSSSLDAQAKSYLQRIQDGTRKMGQLVDELLTLARVGRQETNLQVTGLNSIVREVIGVLQPEIEGRQVEWKIAELPFVECDPTLIRQVFQNLISNALKYSRPRPLAVIEIGQMQDDGHSAIFVRDNGVGFSMKYADKLFGVFQRLHRAEDFEGTGVGLATVQRIVKKHQGRVWANAELDKGASFYFTIGGLLVADSNKELLAVGV